MSNSGRLRSLLLALLIAFALIGTACGAAARPTVTAETLPAAAEDLLDQPAPPSADAAPADEPAPATNDAAPDEAAPAEASPDEPAPAEQAAIEFLVVEVLEQLPHDETAFTQGLELRDGLFLESTGLVGESTLRRVEPSTGEVLQSVPIQEPFFAEGLTQIGDEIVQLTWRENTAFFWDAETFTPTREVAYEGEGWGICFDSNRLIMTDGTPTLIFRDAATFDEIGRIPVTFNGQPLDNLNEVECVNGQVWANLWLTNQIVRIDPATGAVTALVDVVGLDPLTETSDVLNGIAWDASTESFYITGKLWPTMYRVNFVPRG